MIAFRESIRHYFLIYFLLLQIIVVQLLSFFPQVIEEVYSNGIYVYSSNFFRIVLGWIGFSVGDIIYGVVIAYLIFKIIKTRKSITFKSSVINVLKGFSIFYFLFNLMWGLNYYRVPLSEKMNLTYEYSFEDLLLFTDKMIEKSNALHLEIVADDSLKVVNPYSTNEIYQMAQHSYNLLSEKYPEFTYINHSVKSSLISTPLSYMGFGGYMNPFTGEAQVNYLLPKYLFPTTTLHEMSHQIGYASESEANFIGYLASVNSEDMYFRYSGTIFALRYCLRNIEKFNSDLIEEYLSKVNPGIRLNFLETEEFWEEYETPIERFFEIFYDTFLKANSQEEGLESYSKFVGLLISYESR